MHAIEIRGLRHRYGGQEATLALDGIDLAVPCGQFVAIVGANGSGKSTLARHVNALLLPTEGEVFVCGLDTRHQENLWEIRRRAGMIFQNPDNQLVAAVVEDDVAFGLENLGLPPAEIAARVDEALERVGMLTHRRRPPHQLSGGQKQRVAIAGVLAMRPDILICDEATAMLDPSGRGEVFRAVRELHAELGITVLWITHFMDEAAHAERVLVMRAGRVMLDGAPAEVFSQTQELAAAGLELPAAAALATLLRKRGLALPAAVLSEDDLLASLAQLRPVDGVPSAPTNSGASGAPSPSSQVPSPAAVIEVRDLRHTYGHGTPFAHQALQGVDLQIRPGERIGLIGATGSGKSTLVQHFNALLLPTQGEVQVSGRSTRVRGRELRDIRRQVGLVFQYPEQQLFDETVWADVAFGPKNLGLEGEALNEAVAWALEALGVPPSVWKSSPFRLSGGQMRRVAIAGVLAMRPPVLVLDEPTAGLDPAGRRAMLGLIDSLGGDGRTIVLISHSMDEVAEVSDRLVVMHDGRVVAAGAPAEVFRRADELTKLGLGVPFAARLARHLRQRDWPIDEAVLTLDELARQIARATAVGPFPACDGPTEAAPLPSPDAAGDCRSETGGWTDVP